MLSVDVYQQHLNKVSRSFAFCIAKLELPLKAWVGMTYLLCRILDTIEDASWDSNLTQQKQFEAFDRFLKDKASSTQLKEWSRNFPDSIPSGEKDLIADSERIFSDLHNQDQSGGIRSIVQQLGRSMSAGMQHFAKKKENGQLKLTSIMEVNQYCFFVAGLVGEALARLLAQVEPKFRLVEQRVLEAHHFGLFLQKVNLLKDQLGDEQEGRFLVPNRQEVLDSLKLNAEGAFRFLSHLPKNQKSFRLFCAWSLFLGLGTLAVTEKAYRKRKSAKLERKDADELLSRVEKAIDKPEVLEKLFLELGRYIDLDLSAWKNLNSSLETNIETNLEGPKLTPASTWLTEIYDGDLAQSDLKKLGLVEAS